jgi:sialate O-acetylesterase
MSMIEAWRDAFRQPEMPFFFVQLPKLGARDVRDGKVTRESQMWTANNIKNTGMVVTLDVGEAGLHPKLKRPIGQRLEKLARAKVYGQDAEYASPLYKSAKIEGSKIVLQFDKVHNGLISNDGQPLREFTICGADHNFVVAEAKIVGNTVVVLSDDVAKPVAVRYTWKNDPMVNLFGKNGLPVGPFRTDTFQLPEKNP